MERHTVFVSYSHQDRKYLDRLRVHMRPLEKQGLIDLWADTRLNGGTSWRAEIAGAISRSKVAVLLVSADFLASAFITEDELPPLLHAAEIDGITILPVIIGPCRFTKTASINHLQAINNPERSLSLIPVAEREKVWVQVADAVEAALANQDPREGWHFSMERKARESLNELLNSPPTSFLIIGTGDYYVQFWRDDESIQTEAVSNAFLPDRLQIDPYKQSRLLDFGFSAPTKTIQNFYRVDVISDAFYLTTMLAKLAIDALATVYEVSQDAKVEFNVTEGNG